MRSGLVNLSNQCDIFAAFLLLFMNVLIYYVTIITPKVTWLGDMQYKITEVCFKSKTVNPAVRMLQL